MFTGQWNGLLVERISPEYQNVDSRRVVKSCHIIISALHRSSLLSQGPKYVVNLTFYHNMTHFTENRSMFSWISHGVLLHTPPLFHCNMTPSITNISESEIKNEEDVSCLTLKKYSSSSRSLSLSLSLSLYLSLSLSLLFLLFLHSLADLH